MDVKLSFGQIIDKAFSSFKKVTPLLVAIALVSGGMLFLPEHILAKMSLNLLPEIWIRIIGIVFLTSTALFLVILVFGGIRKIVKKVQSKEIIRTLRRRYIKLPSVQKNTINQLLHSDNMRIELDSTSGATQYLLNNKFIFQPEQNLSIDSVDAFSHSIRMVYTPQPWLVDLFFQEPDLFK